MAVFGLVSSVAGFIKVRYLVDKAIIDNMVFRCHYRLTSAVLFLSCVLVTANNLIGDPISCINDGAIPGHVINTYCWITYTFTLPGQHGRPLGTAVAHSGLGNEYNQERTYHSYYQWVPFMLFFQGLLFYMPHWIWKNWEEGKMRMISDGLRGALTLGVGERKERQGRLIRYLYESKKTHNAYAFGYFICEALNFVNVIGNIFFVDKFLGGAFMTYGSDVLKFSDLDQENRSDPMIEVFPRVTKCTFHKYGASGSIQKHDALCVLALNILNEKIYIFLWFWFIILSILSGLAILYSAAIVMMPTTREAVLKRRFRTATSSQIQALVRRIQIGDFLMIHLLGQNINVTSYGEVLHSLMLAMQIPDPGRHTTPSAPSTMEMAPMYPEVPKYADKEKEALHQEYDA
ncbi:innexin inx3 isoform X1 [Uranotaenia lowii]|uniref:innexin inx3 isoform X1 n=1 Tax=Uranotaenia lowii TaxID=190385 RepID=UPI0024794D31|nr:innexin inx3 isoform X1 [Uranotaenia lowii]XP_055588293.1 innexin inx3 isoform X1 [Uranotaenia lowii]XP_055588294.1 innexin inx3 isoform X1 [Uranotaenia lowii]XP_055588295.1 innexin inx3 isoform X1 [Uranotaenia lowii]XP_055588296.1 innexin inx3 isoform X1 [Uranotaenia lowii]